MNSPLSNVRRNLGLLVACQAMLFTINSTLIAINGLALAPMAALPLIGVVLGRDRLAVADAASRASLGSLSSSQKGIQT